MLRSIIVDEKGSEAAADRVGVREYVVPDDASGLSRYTWYVVGLLTVVNVVNYADRMALAVLAPSIQRDLHLSDSQLGLLTGLAFSIFYAICGIPIARWADRGVRRDILALALTTWSVMTALSGAAQHFIHLLLARVGIGAGEAGCLPSAQSVICDYVPAKRRPAVFAIHTAGTHGGILFGMFVASWLGEIMGWRLAFVVLGLPGIALALILKITLKEPARGTLDVVRSEGRPMSFLSVLAILKDCRTYRYLLSFYVLNGFIVYGLLQWWPSFYSRSFHLGMSSIGLYLGLAYGIGAACGILIGGSMANKLGSRDGRLPLMVGAAFATLAIPACIASLFVSSVETSITLVSMAAFCFSVSNGPVIATGVGIVSSQIRATSQSLLMFATSVLGLGLGPLCIGVLSDRLSPLVGEQALRYALLLPVCLIPALVFSLYGAAKSSSADLLRQPIRRREE